MRSPSPPHRGRSWFDALGEEAVAVETSLPSVLVADGTLAGEPVRLLAIVPDPAQRFVHARRGEVGLDEGWALAQHVREAIALDEGAANKRALIAIIDSRSQAYGRLEELLGIHLALAASADAYASARILGHPIVGLIVGQAISGALLAHGMQSSRLLALDDPGVRVHAMHESSAAKVTHRSVGELEALGKTIPPMSYDIRQYEKLGLLHELIRGVDADAPTAAQVAQVKGRVVAAIADAREKHGGPVARVRRPGARANRAASIEVRRRMLEQWDAYDDGHGPPHA